MEEGSQVAALQAKVRVRLVTKLRTTRAPHTAAYSCPTSLNGPSDPALAQSSAQAHDPLLQWAASDLGVALTYSHSVYGPEHSPEAVETVRKLLQGEPWKPAHGPHVPLTVP